VGHPELARELADHNLALDSFAPVHNLGHCFVDNPVLGHCFVDNLGHCFVDSLDSFAADNPVLGYSFAAVDNFDHCFVAPVHNFAAVDNLAFDLDNLGHNLDNFAGVGAVDIVAGVVGIVAGVVDIVAAVVDIVAAVAGIVAVVGIVAAVVDIVVESPTVMLIAAFYLDFISSKYNVSILLNEPVQNKKPEIKRLYDQPFLFKKKGPPVSLLKMRNLPCKRKGGTPKKVNFSLFSNVSTGPGILVFQKIPVIFFVFLTEGYSSFAEVRYRINKLTTIFHRGMMATRYYDHKSSLY